MLQVKCLVPPSSWNNVLFHSCITNGHNWLPRKACNPPWWIISSWYTKAGLESGTKNFFFGGGGVPSGSVGCSSCEWCRTNSERGIHANTINHAWQKNRWSKRSLQKQNKNKPTTRTSQRNYRNRNVGCCFFTTTTNHFNFMPITKTRVWNIFFQSRGLDQAEMKESPEGKPKTTHTAPWWLVAEWLRKPLILPVWR